MCSFRQQFWLQFALRARARTVYLYVPIPPTPSALRHALRIPPPGSSVSINVNGAGSVAKGINDSEQRVQWWHTPYASGVGNTFDCSRLSNPMNCRCMRSRKYIQAYLCAHLYALYSCPIHSTHPMQRRSVTTRVHQQRSHTIIHERTQSALQMEEPAASY